LVAALGSFLSARRKGGIWLVRMEDVDETRCNSKHASEILKTLECYGFEWDGEVLFQSVRKEHYNAHFEALRAANRIYPCGCSRSDLSAARRDENGEVIYPGICWQAPKNKSRGDFSFRFRVSNQDQQSHKIVFQDRVEGRMEEDVAHCRGDFVVKRADGFFAYQFAVVCDDLAQGVTEVVRGRDLLSSTARQISLYEAMGGQPPCYAHLPIVLSKDGKKLSKQTGAAALPTALESERVRVLIQALKFLECDPPSIFEMPTTSLKEVWAWALNCPLDQLSQKGVPAWS
jgi:glutamyl-Q tRNA(Asp) synthetase